MISDIVTAAATLLTFGLIGIAGLISALLILGRDRSLRDRLALSVATLIAATAEAIAIALGLGAIGQLRFSLALLVLSLLVLALLAAFRAIRGDDLESLLRAASTGLLRSTWDRLREHPFLALMAGQAIVSESLRGVLRPPLSWDSIMYHLPLAATWLQDHAVSVVYGAPPMNFYGYVPANGSLWTWWWMAPSHSELYVNLAFLPHWALLGLATGAVARELGARRAWPLAAYLVLLCPVVLRFAATEYIDILLAAMIVAGLFFGLLWMYAPKGYWGGAVFIGLAFGVAAGTKALGPPFAGLLALALVVLARSAWKIRFRQAALALLLASLLGSYFYLRNIAVGAGPFAVACSSGGSSLSAPTHPTVLESASVARNLGRLIENGTLLDAVLGDAEHSATLELGIGPQGFLLLAVLVLPWLALRGHRRASVVLWSLILWQGLIFLFVPPATAGLVFANLRYVMVGIALSFAGLLAVAEERGRGGRGLVLLAGMLMVQDLLMLHATMPRQVRLAMACADILVAVLKLAPGWRAALFQRRVPIGVATGALLLFVGAPWLASFRAHDRTRAMTTEFTAHATIAHYFARAWGWLDRHGEDGTVAVTMTPANFFTYPAMGLHLERRAVYVNINRVDHHRATEYPGCYPRVDPDPEAWLQNLAKDDVRWVLVGHLESVQPPIEDTWAAARPDQFALRYADPNTAIYERLATTAHPSL
jgi:hypothetical protein